MSRRYGLWYLTIMMGLAGCDGTAIFVPEDNTRVHLSSGSSAPYAVHVLLDSAEHAWASDPNNDLRDIFRLDSYRDSSGGWSTAPVAPPQFTGTPLNLPTGTSYWWRFDIDLYSLGLYHEPGTYGGSFMFRVHIMSESGTWQAVPGLTVDWQECLRMLQAGEPYCPYTYEIRLRSQYYVPDITNAETNCVYGDSDCSQCVPNIASQVAGLEKLNGIVMNVVDCCRSRKPHIQGIARLPDWDTGYRKLGRIVSTNNITGQGFEWGYQGSPDNVPPQDPSVEEWWRADVNLNAAARDFDVSLDYDHPSGIQAHGNVVAIALENPKYGSGHAQVMFARTRSVLGSFAGSTREEWEIANRFTLNGSQGEPDQPNAEGIVGAATVGFVKLASGYFLMAVASTDHGRDGIWFYESSSTTINQSTDWYFIEYWQPPCVGKEWGCYYGAGGGLNLQAGCDGYVYLLAMHGSEDRAAGDNDSVLQLFRLDQDAGGIHLTKRAWWERTFNSELANNSFRWAGGSYVSRDGTLVILDTRRRNGPLGGIGGVVARKFKDVEIQQYVNPSFAN